MGGHVADSFARKAGFLPESTGRPSRQAFGLMSSSSDVAGVPNLPARIEAERTYLRLPSRPSWIEPTVDYLRQKALLCGACHEGRVNKLTVALHEAITNSIVHGNLEVSSELKERDDNAFAETLAQRAADPVLSSRRVEITVDYDGQRCRWILQDQGPGFDLEQVLRQKEEAASLESPLASGRGILIMRAFMDEVQYEDNGRRVILTLFKTSGRERREQGRIPTHRTVRIAPIRPDGSIDWNAAYEAMSRDISDQGIGLLQKQLATAARVMITVDHQGRTLHLPAEIRHWRQLDEDLVELGCRFVLTSSAPAPPPGQPSVAEAVGHLIEDVHRQATVVVERRTHPRYSYTAKIRVTGPSLGDGLFAYARDISKSGIAFISTVPLPLEEFSLTLPQRSGPPLKVRARIVRCGRIMEGFYDVGARFVSLEAE